MGIGSLPIRPVMHRQLSPVLLSVQVWRPCMVATASLPLDECEIPHQKWITLCEAIIALMIGGAGDISDLEDPRLTPAASDLAEAAIQNAAYQGIVHVYGYRGEADERGPRKL